MNHLNHPAKCFFAVASITRRVGEIGDAFVLRVSSVGVFVTAREGSSFVIRLDQRNFWRKLSHTSKRFIWMVRGCLYDLKRSEGGEVKVRDI